MIKFALIKERKSPPDRRVVFSPEQLKVLSGKFPEAIFKVESSNVRVFPDEEYTKAGFQVTEDVSDCDVLLGVKEVPVEALIPQKKYFFFSHTIKKQPYNRNLLRAILDLKIELYDHEAIVKDNGQRLIGFGRYAGLVGAYNCFRALGLKMESYNLPKAENLADLNELKEQLDSIEIPAKKILLTGSGKVAFGAKEILDHLKIEKVSIDDYLKKSFNYPVFCHIDVLDYNMRKDGQEGSNLDFYKHPTEYTSNFIRFAQVSDIFIAGHFYGDSAPVFFTQEDAKSPQFNIEIIADISCDVNGPIPSTIRASTIEDPFYGYNPTTGTEVKFGAVGSISVMAVDNLPCELPRDASIGFGEMFLEHVIPSFFNNDKEGILKRAKMTHNGLLTDRFEYLQDYVNEQPKKNEYV